MIFRDIELSDRALIENAAAEADSLSCDDSFVNMYIWRELYAQQIALCHGTVLRRSIKNGMLRFSFPLGRGDLPLILAEVAQMCEGRPSFEGLTQQECREVVKCLPGYDFFFEEKPDRADYIYRREDLALLSGKKYHQKRNFVNRFRLENADRYTSDPFTPEDAPEILAFNRRLCSGESCVGGSLEREGCALGRALAHPTELGLEGRVIRLEGKVIAFSLCSRITPRVADVHFEKAVADIAGAYATENNHLALSLEDVEYLNREEDMGIPGRKMAKESYRPTIHLMRYSARGEKR